MPQAYRQLKNDLNRRAQDAARKLGRDLTEVDKLEMPDLDAVAHYYGYHCLVPDCVNTDYTFDHVISLDEGGENIRENLQLLCEHHNKSKKNTTADYRPADKPFCPKDYELPQKNTKAAYRHHDYDALESEYIHDPAMTLDKMAEKYNMIPTLLYKQSTKRGWFRKKMALFGEITEESAERAKKALIDGELNSRMILHDVIEVATRAFMDKPKASAADLAALLKLGLATQGEVTDNIHYVELVEDDDVIEAAERIARRAERQAEASDIARSPSDEDGQGAGWTD